MEVAFSSCTQLFITQSNTSNTRKFDTPKCTLAHGPTGASPNYRETIDRLPHNTFFMRRFQSALDTQLSLSADTYTGTVSVGGADGFDRVIASVLALADIHSDDTALQKSSLQVLRSLLPSWLPGVFYAVFVRASSELAAAMCAYVTVFATQWLMGTSSVSNDDDDDSNNVVKIERCRYLEESKCMGICLNSCKIPTEQFFREDMRMNLHVKPNFEDYSCKFRFGAAPPHPKDDPAFKEPCFANCPLASRRSNQRLCSDP